MMTALLTLSTTVQADTITFSGNGAGISVPTTDPSKPAFDFLGKGTAVTSFGTFTLVEAGSVNFAIANPDGQKCEC